jgi:mannose-6-phosphate isomerase-like protein (cupin superfamily)
MTRRLHLVQAHGATEFFTGERCHITELLNDASVPDVSVARARVEPGVTTELHCLDCAETYVIVAGHGLMEGGDGGRFAVGPGDSIDIPAGAPQRISVSGDSDLIFLCVCRPRFLPAYYHGLEPLRRR